MAYADLEIGIRRVDADRYGISMRYNDPRSAADRHLLESVASSTATINEDLLASLLACSHDLDATGALLRQRIFEVTGADAALREAISAAQAANFALRVRLHLNLADRLLHQIRWETLALPLDDQGHAPTFLAMSQRVTFSRYLESADPRPVTLRSLVHLRAAALVANPSGSAFRLSPINVVDEIARARQALGPLPLRTPALGERATLDTLVALLSGSDEDTPDILYLVAHGRMISGSEGCLFLENDMGGVAIVTGEKLVAALRLLPSLPRLIVLASCESAGDETAQAFRAIGPQLSTLGVPAVVAMQGAIGMRTAATFSAALFRELRLHGCIDRAVAGARWAVRDQLDWWMPVLYMRLRTGQLWSEGGSADPSLASLLAWLRNIAQELSRDSLRRLGGAIQPHLMSAGVDHRSYRSLEALLADLHVLEGPELWAQLEPLLEELLPRPPLGWTRLAALESILAGAALAPSILETLYESSFLPIKRPHLRGLPAPVDAGDLLAHIIRRLGREQIGPGGEHPLLAFLALLLEPEVGETGVQRVRANLVAWREEAARHLGVPAAPQAPGSSPQPKTARLVLQVERSFEYGGQRPDGLVTDDTPVRVAGWLMRGREPLATLGEVVEVPFSAVPGVFARMFAAGRRALAQHGGGRPVVEFVLPFSLALTAVERWEYTVPNPLADSRMPVGWDYPVTVRVLERSQNEELAGELQAKAGAFRAALGHQAAPALIPVADEHTCNPERLYLVLRSEGLVGIAQSYVPVCSAGVDLDRLATVLGMTVAAGAPVALLLRDNIPAGRAQTGFAPLLDQILADLPAAVAAERRGAALSTLAGHIGNALVLLWDDPDLPIPAAPFAQPRGA